MDFKRIAPDFSVSPQLQRGDIGVAAARGFRSIIINRPDGEGDEQPDHSVIEELAQANGLQVSYQPIVAGQISDQDVENYSAAMRQLPGPVLGYCRSGLRALTLWSLAQAPHLSVDAILATAKAAGYDLSGLRDRLVTVALASSAAPPSVVHDIVIIGGGAAGIASAASLLNRRPDLDIAIVEPRAEHYYQPGWTLVGAGVFDRKQTERPMLQVMPNGVHWIRAACSAFEPDRELIRLEDGETVGYRVLVVASGLELDWAAIDGLPEALGTHGVTSNYLFDMAPYTWQCVNTLKSGKALFTQPPMPIKCAGAPQKALYMSCDAWRRNGVLESVDVSFNLAGDELFGVSEYVPALRETVKDYGINVAYRENLVAVEAQAHKAIFNCTDPDGNVTRTEREFDLLHVCPPQCAPDFVRNSALANADGWVEVDQQTLQHVVYGNVFGIGDVASTPNAKTAAAVRKQAPVVAENVLSVLDGLGPHAVYSGYGSCPLVLARGQALLAEFAYGGKLEPTFPRWLVDGTKPSRFAWWLKLRLMPTIYFDMMLKGREYLVKTEKLPYVPRSSETEGV